MKIFKLSLILSSLFSFSQLKSQTLEVVNNSGCNLLVRAYASDDCTTSCETAEIYVAQGNTVFLPATCWQTGYKWVVIKYVKAGASETGGVEKRISNCGPNNQAYQCASNIVWPTESKVIIQ